MGKFVFIYTGGRGMALTPAEQEASMKAWMGWMGGLGSAVVDGGNPFMPMAKHVNTDGSIADGPVGAMAGGYTIVSAESLVAAAQMAKTCPGLAEGSQVTVYEIMQVM